MPVYSPPVKGFGGIRKFPQTFLGYKTRFFVVTKKWVLKTFPKTRRVLDRKEAANPERALRHSPVPARNQKPGKTRSFFPFQIVRTQAAPVSRSAAYRGMNVGPHLTGFLRSIHFFRALSALPIGLYKNVASTQPRPPMARPTAAYGMYFQYPRLAWLRIYPPRDAARLS